MHFFYLDETGCTGADLANDQQPIFVLGGISIKDQGWRETTERFRDILADKFGGVLPPNFELHAGELLNGNGAFEGFDRDARNALVFELLDLIAERKHPLHFVAIDKKRLAEAEEVEQHPIIDLKIPYLLSFNYLVTYIEQYARNVLGRTVRAMIILDQKDLYQNAIDSLTSYRRFEVVKARRLKWLVEFSYPVDSVRHPMIQLSDLVIFLVRKFLELDNGYRPAWPEEAKHFFAACYAKILPRVRWGTLIEAAGPEERPAHRLLRASSSTHRRNWKKRYGL